jgi:hypothetical protein
MTLKICRILAIGHSSHCYKVNILLKKRIDRLYLEVDSGRYSRVGRFEIKNIFRIIVPLESIHFYVKIPKKVNKIVLDMSLIEKTHNLM